MILIRPTKSDSTQPAMAASGDATLGVGTYFYPFNCCAARTDGHLQLRWDATLVAEVTFEDTSWSEDAAPLTSTTAGDWIPEDPPDAYVAAVGGTATGLAVSIPGGSAGGCVVHLSDFAAERGRLKVVVATGGVVRCAVGSKGL